MGHQDRSWMQRSSYGQEPVLEGSGVGKEVGPSPSAIPHTNTSLETDREGDTGAVWHCLGGSPMLHGLPTELIFSDPCPHLDARDNKREQEALNFPLNKESFIFKEKDL